MSINARVAGGVEGMDHCMGCSRHSGGLDKQDTEAGDVTGGKQAQLDRLARNVWILLAVFTVGK